MFGLIIEVVNALPDAVRFVGLDVAEALGVLEGIAAFVRDNGCTLFEDGSIGCP